MMSPRISDPKHTHIHTLKRRTTNLIHRQAEIDRLQRRVAADAKERELGEAVRDQGVHGGGRGERLANCGMREKEEEEG